MSRLSRSLPTCLAAFFLSLPTSVFGELVLDFNELGLSQNSYFDGYGFSATTGSWTSQGASFHTNQYGPGWSYSNVNDPTTPGFGNQWAAITGTGVGGTGNYVQGTIGFDFGTNAAIPAVINLPIGYRPSSVQATNTSYTYYSMRDGDAFATKFGGVSGNDPDFFKVTFSGFTGLDGTGAATGSVDFFLGDYRFANNALDYLVNQWTNVDLTNLGNAASIAIIFEGSVFSDGFLATPTYVAIDNLALTAVPEPHSAILFLTAFAVVARRRARFQR
jgi:hypothetical protein